MFAKSVIDSEKKFDDLSHSVGVGVGQLHALQSAAAFKGIDTEDFAKGMAHFAGSVYQAQHGMGELADVFRANNTTAKSFTDYLEKASDLIKNAGSDQQRLQLLQQMGLPATMDWVRFLSQGKDAIRAATEEATKFDEAAEQKMVASARRFDEAWDKAWKNFSTGAKSGILTALDAMTQLSDKADGLAKTVGNAAFWKNFIPAGTDPTKFGLQSVSTAESRIGGAFSAAAETSRPIS
jgi:conjugal transfer/entry exclusion protein